MLAQLPLRNGIHPAEDRRRIAPASAALGRVNYDGALSSQTAARTGGFQRFRPDCETGFI
jgi:hypothetical protein